MENNTPPDRRCGTCRHYVEGARRRQGLFRDGVCVWCTEESPPWLDDYVHPVDETEGVECKSWEKTRG